MSLELTLLPVDEFTGCCFTLLPLLPNSNYLFHNIQECLLDIKNNTETYLESLVGQEAQVGIIKSINTYLAKGKDGEPCYGVVTEDYYGNPLYWMTARKLIEIKEKNPSCFTNYRSHAAWAYLEKLDPENRVVLFWS